MEDLYLELKNEEKNNNIRGSIIIGNGYVKWSYDCTYDVVHGDLNHFLKNIMLEDFDIINEILEDYSSITVSEPEIDDSNINVYFSN